MKPFTVAICPLPIRDGGTVEEVGNLLKFAK